MGEGLGHSCGPAPHQCSTSPHWWHWRRWRSRACPCDGNTQGYRGIASHGALWGPPSKQARITAESKKELVELLHMLKRSISSSETWADVPNYKRAKKQCWAIQKQLHKYIKVANQDLRNQKTQALLSAGKEPGVYWIPLSFLAESGSNTVDEAGNLRRRKKTWWRQLNGVLGNWLLSLSLLKSFSEILPSHPSHTSKALSQ